jgi:hypothetical protein
LSFSPDGSHLASGLKNGTILLWEVAPPKHLRQLEIPPLDAKRVESLWSDLAGVNARRAHAAIWALATAPGQTVSLLKERVKPAPRVDVKRVQRLVADLDSSEYILRQAAADQLRELREHTEVKRVMRQALAGKPSPEVRRRLEPLLSKANVLGPGQLLRSVRAVEILERIGAAEARDVLMHLAEGPAEARLTREAKASLERLAKQPVPAQ